MGRLIDIDKRMEEWNKLLKASYPNLPCQMFHHFILSAPSVDAVEVVRCRECKHAIVNENHIDKPLICCLTKMVGTTDEDWFCAAGELKMDGGASDAAD